MHGFGRHACLCRESKRQRICKRFVAIIDFGGRCNIAKGHVNGIGSTHEGCSELVGFVTAAVADYTRQCAVSCPYIVAKGFVQLCQDGVLCWVGHNGLDVAVFGHVCLCSL